MTLKYSENPHSLTLGLKLTIITVSLNAALTIRDTIESVLSQTQPDFEYIIIDGGSTDGTKEIVESYGSGISKFISEPDTGMYDALNKGIRLATGDIVGSLNADDVYTSNKVLSKVATEFRRCNPDCLFGDAHFVKEADLSTPVRYISGKAFKPYKLRFGFMPPHPTFFVRRNLFDNYGFYKTDYEIASDYELIIRFLYPGRSSFHYLPLDMVSMKMGGKSTRSLRSNYILNKEIVRACRENGIYTNLPVLTMKYFIKVFELIKARKQSIL